MATSLLHVFKYKYIKIMTLNEKYLIFIISTLFKSLINFTSLKGWSPEKNNVQAIKFSF